MLRLKYAVLAATLLEAARASLYAESPVNHTCVLGIHCSE